MEYDQQVLGVYYASASKWRARGVAGVGGEPLWERFLDVEVDAGGGMYALMSKSLADAGRWEDASAVREDDCKKDREGCCMYLDLSIEQMF